MKYLEVLQVALVYWYALCLLAIGAWCALTNARLWWLDRLNWNHDFAKAFSAVRKYRRKNRGNG